MIGTFALLRKRALIGDAIAHSLLPGLCLGFILSGEKNLSFLLVGAFISGWLSTYAVDLIVNKSKVKQDAAIGIVLSTFFAVGVVLLTYIQNNAAGQQAGLDHFLFGQAAAITKNEILIFGLIFFVVVITIVVFYRSFVAVTFNKDFAHSIGLPVRFIEFLITSLTVMAIASGIQAMGVILMSALVVAPGVAGRFWSHNLKKIIFLAITFSVLSGIAGAYISYSSSGMPTGPWVVVIMSLIVGVSILLAPNSGILSRYNRGRQNRSKILHENILKAIFLYHEKKEKVQLDLKLSVHDLMEVRKFDTTELRSGLNKLKRKGLVLEDGSSFGLTDAGQVESKRVVRLHRLWEQYLLKRTQIDTEHVHSGAEAIEHILTPEIEAELERELGIKGIPKEDY
jgi:manganese/zinc/iron transport system permease protein